MASRSNPVCQQILDTAQSLIGGRGFVAVGLNEILQAAKVPKGSFYHYFGSKDAFGEALLERYFDAYMSQLEALFGQPGLSAAERLLNYWAHWRATQADCDPKGQCLAVKLAAEVSDLSQPMRAVLQQGTDRIIARLASVIDEAFADGSLPPSAVAASPLAAVLYQLWLGASLRAKITRDAEPLELALAASYRLLGLSRSVA
ncbi:family transcriptional regulator [Lasius niger]|uniref:Family transcriptional regulator n=1 Tax=Lasius niger TaxID=67767 RepID=A0A0J7JYQ5_LASNI|nr:family transcriptional regulator [Lasius niger]